MGCQVARSTTTTTTTLCSGPVSCLPIFAVPASSGCCGGGSLGRVQGQEGHQGSGNMGNTGNHGHLFPAQIHLGYCQLVTCQIDLLDKCCPVPCPGIQVFMLVWVNNNASHGNTSLDNKPSAVITCYMLQISDIFWTGNFNENN